MDKAAALLMPCLLHFVGPGFYPRLGRFLIFELIINLKKTLNKAQA